MLAGSLDAFGLPDVFQLLAITKKSGTLRIRSAKSEGRVEFRNGEIAYAVSDTKRMALASRLLGGGLVNDSQLRHIVAAQRGGAASLSRALLEDDVLDDATFDTFVREQIQDAVFELMRLREGSFDFDALDTPGPDSDDPSIRLTVSPEQLVTEGQRRLQEWSQIQEHVVSFDAVVTLAPQAPASGESSTVSMDAEQWRLLTFVDGRRTVRDLVDLTGQGEYATCQVIAGLVNAGLVEVVDPAAGGRTGLSELVARHELLRRLEERELGGGSANGSAQTSRARPPVVSLPDPPPRPPMEERVVTPPPPEAQPVQEMPEVDDPQDLTPLPPTRHDEDDEDVFVLPEPQRAERAARREPEQAAPVGLPRAEEPAPVAAATPAATDDDDDFGPVVGYEQDLESDHAFDRAEVERELAALGFRDGLGDHGLDGDDTPAQNPFRINRSDDVNKGLLSRLIDVRKHP